MKSAGREGRVAAGAGAEGVLVVEPDCTLVGDLAGFSGLPFGQTPQMRPMTARPASGYTHLGTPPPASSTSVLGLRAATTVGALENEPGAPGPGGFTPGRRGCRPVVRLGTFAVSLWETLPVGGRAMLCVVEPRSGPVTAPPPMGTAMGMASATATGVSLNQPTEARSRKVLRASDALAGRSLGSRLISHITQSQIGSGRRGASVFRGCTRCSRCMFMIP